jgi:hypothetical protein
MGRETTIPNWEFAGSIYLPKWHCLVYRDERLGVQREEYTKRHGATPRGKPKVSYFITGVKGRFRTEKQLMRAWAKKSKEGRVDKTVRIVAREVLVLVALLTIGFLYVEFVHYHQFHGLGGPQELIDEFLSSLNHLSRPYIEERGFSLLAPYLAVQAGRVLFLSIRKLTQRHKPVL